MSLAERSIAFLSEQHLGQTTRFKDIVREYVFNILGGSEVEMWSSVFGVEGDAYFTDTLLANRQNVPSPKFSSVLTLAQVQARLRNHTRIELVAKPAINVGDIAAPRVIIAYLSEASIGEEKLEIARKVLEKIASDAFHLGVRRIHELMINASHLSKDLTSFLHRAIHQVLIPEFHLQAASVFYFEEKTQSLILGASTGIPRQDKLDLKRSDIRYFVDDKSYTARCWKSGIEIVENVLGGPDLRRNTQGEHPRRIYSRVNAPLRRWIDRRDDMPASPVGVVRAVNFNEDANFHPLTHFEANRLRVFCDSASVLTERYVRALSILHDQERATHGYNTDLAAIRYAAQNSEKWLARAADPKQSSDQAAQALQEVQYRIRDILAVQDNMASQILTVMHHAGSTRMVGRQSEAAPCEQPFKEVIMRLVHAKKGMSECYGRNELFLTFAGDQKASETFIKIPALKVTVGLLYLVFRNLAENSIKYSVKGTRPQLDIAWRRYRGNVMFTFKDSGIGIPKDEHHLVLREGFRGRGAQELQLRGNGLGLAVSQSMLKVVGGDIRFIQSEDHQSGACFEVSVPEVKFTGERA